MSKEKSKITLQIGSLIIAIILWGYVMSEVNPEKSDYYKNISVVFNNIEALERQGLILMEPKDVTVNVKVRGNKTDLAKLSQLSKPIKASVDLSGYNEGQVKVPVSVILDQFSNVSIEKVEPSEILFTFDKLITKDDKPVTIKTSGNPEPGYVIGDITTKSQSILLSGPRTWVNEVSEIEAIVKINGRKENSNITVPIKLLDDQGNDVRGVNYEPSVIDVNIPVFRTVTLPIELKTERLPENYEIADISISPSVIALKGDKNIVNLTYIETKQIAIDTLMNNDIVNVELDLPRNVSLLNPDQKITVSLNIQEAYTKTFEYNLDEIKFEGLDENLTIDKEESTNTVEIVLKGNKEDIDLLSKEDIELYLNLNIYGEGTHNVYISNNIPEGLAVKSITPQPIKLKLISN